MQIKIYVRNWYGPISLFAASGEGYSRIQATPAPLITIPISGSLKAQGQISVFCRAEEWIYRQGYVGEKNCCQIAMLYSFVNYHQ